MEEYTLNYKDGSLWVKGWMENGLQQGYWEWFRKDGVRLRSGHFENGKAVGEWTAYDKHGEVYTVTTARDFERRATSDRRQGEGDLPKGIGGPATAVLKLEGLVWLKDIAQKTDKELLSLHGVGPRAVRILRETILGSAEKDLETRI